MKIHSILPLVVGGIIFGFSILYFSLYLNNKKQNRRELVFALTCLCMALHNTFCALLYNSSSVEESVLWHRLRFIAINLNALSLSWFYYYYTKTISKKELYSISVYIFLTTIINYIILELHTFKSVHIFYREIPLPFDTVFPYYQLPIKFHLIPEVIMAFIFIIYLIKAGIQLKKSKSKLSKLYFITIFIFFMVLINDYFVVQDYINNIFLLEYGFLFIVFLMGKSMIEELLTISNLKKELVETSENYQYLYNNAPVGLFRTDIETGYIIQCNKKVAEIFNSDDPGEIINKIKPVAYYPMKVREEMLQILNKDEEVQDFYIHAQFPNPLIKDIIVNAKIFHKSGYIEGAVIDVTNLKHTENELNNYRNNLEKLVKERTMELEMVNKKLKFEIENSDIKTNMLFNIEQRFKSFTDLIPEMIFETDNNGFINYLNKAALNMSGYSEDDVTNGLNALQFISPESHDKIRTNLKKVLTGEIISPNEYLALRKDGSTFPIRIHSTPIHQDGKIVGIRGLVIDITEQKNAEKKILQTMHEAKSANEAKSVFIANMSHEFKTPLNSILGYCQMLETKRMGELNEKQLSYVSIIKDNGTHLLHLINEILDISKIQAGKMTICMDKFDISQLIIRVIKSLLPLAEEKEISIDINIDKNIGLIKADKKRIRQILNNLISNALKFTDNGRHIGIKTIKEKETVQIIVWDQGHGISKENLKTIFEPFEQVSMDAGVKNEGTGLGLSITKKLIEMHGGQISVSSELGSGTTVTVELPIV